MWGKLIGTAALLVGKGIDNYYESKEREENFKNVLDCFSQFGQVKFEIVRYAYFNNNQPFNGLHSIMDFDSLSFNEKLDLLMKGRVLLSNGKIDQRVLDYLGIH